MSFELEGSHWVGQAPNYRHGVEADFMEYDLSGEVKKGILNCYGGCMHEAYGIWSEKKAWSYVAKGGPQWHDSIRVMPADTKLNQYHRYGFLWVPATAKRQGYAKYFFDGKEIGAGWSWDEFTDQPPPPAARWLYSIIDKHHRILILGTGPNQPMAVKSVDVWQKRGDDNLGF